MSEYGGSDCGEEEGDDTRSFTELELEGSELEVDDDFGSVVSGRVSRSFSHISGNGSRLGHSGRGSEARFSFPGTGSEAGFCSGVTVNDSASSVAGWSEAGAEDNKSVKLDFDYRTKYVNPVKKNKKKSWWPGKFDNVGNTPNPKSTPSDTLREEVELIRVNRIAIRHSLYNSPPGSQVEERTLPFNKHFLVIHFGTYAPCEQRDKMYPAEFAIAVFSVRDGLKECYSRMIDPVKQIPLGLGYDFRLGAKEGKYPLPPYDTTFDFDTDVLQPIEELMKKYPSNPDPNGPAYLYTYDLLDGTVKAEKCMAYVMEMAGRKIDFQLFKLATLVTFLVNEGDHLRLLNGYRPVSGGMAIGETQAIGLLRVKEYEYVPDIGCNYHKLEDNQDGLPFCSMSLVKRWVYNILPAICNLYECPRYLHNHIPYYVKVKYVAMPAEVEARETPDYALPPGVGLKNLHAFKTGGGTDGTKPDAGNSASGTFGYRPRRTTFNEYGFGTHQIFPNLCDYAITFSAPKRSISVTNTVRKSLPTDQPSPSPAPSDPSSVKSGNVDIHPTPSPAFSDNLNAKANVATTSGGTPNIANLSLTNSGQSSRTMTPASGKPGITTGGKPREKDGATPAASSSKRMPWVPKRPPSPGDPIELGIPTFQNLDPMPRDPIKARDRRIADYTRCLLPTSLLTGYEDGPMFWDSRNVATPSGGGLAENADDVPHVFGRGRGRGRLGIPGLTAAGRPAREPAGDSNYGDDEGDGASGGRPRAKVPGLPPRRKH